MEINTTDQVQELKTATKISDVKREKEDAPGRQAAQSEQSPDYRISLSNASKKAVGERPPAQAPGRGAEKADLSEEDAARVAQQAAKQLSQTNLSISNHAIQKAIDLFT